MNLFNRKHGKNTRSSGYKVGKRTFDLKALLPLSLIVIFAVCLTIGGTVSFLHAHTETVTNTFNAGSITYTLNLNANANNVEMPSVLYAQESAALSVDFALDRLPRKIGYAFGGWYYDDICATLYPHFADNIITVNYGDSYDRDDDPNKVEISLYASWTPNNYTVVYNGNGATGGSTPDSLHTYDLSRDLTPNGYTRTGFAFLGWSTDPNATTPTYLDQQSVINLASESGETVILYAVWNQMDFTVYFDVNSPDGFVAPNSKTVTYMQAYGDLPVPERDKYKFIGWTLTKDGEDYVTSDTVVQTAADHTLYAKWVGSHEYTVTYYANANNASLIGGVQQVTDTKVQDGSYIIKTPTELNVIRNGYVWTEWNTKADGTGTRYLGGAAYADNSDLTLYAIWAPKTSVTFGNAEFVNMIDCSQTPGANEYNFVIRCKTQGGADGIAIPIYGLIPGEAYRLTFSVTFNNFLFYRDDDATTGSNANGSYIFGTNIIDQYLNYDSSLSILEREGATVTSKYENMQWSTTDGGHFEVFLDFVPNNSTMYWFWETTDIQDGQLMSYEFNNFNIQNRGPIGPRVEFEDLTVTFQTAPSIEGTRWPLANNQVVRHKNYFHTEEFGLDYLEYRVWGYAGHERISIPITGLTVGQWYELTFTQDLTGATVYNSGTIGNNSQLYGCAVSAESATADNCGVTGCVDTMSGYKDLRRVTVGNNHTTSIKFQATSSTMYWHWTLGDLRDTTWSDVRLFNVSLSETTAPASILIVDQPKTVNEINFICDGIDDTNMEWYPLAEQYPVAGDSYELAFEPAEGYAMSDIYVVIDGMTYEVLIDGSTIGGIVSPTYDPLLNILTIPAELLTTETTTVSVSASATAVETDIPPEINDGENILGSIDETENSDPANETEISDPANGTETSDPVDETETPVSPDETETSSDNATDEPEEA